MNLQERWALEQKEIETLLPKRVRYFATPTKSEPSEPDCSKQKKSSSKKTEMKKS